MKLLHTEFLFDYSEYQKAAWFKEVEAQLHEAIRVIHFPLGSTDFAINPTIKGNGVPAIKEAFIAKLEQLGWSPEFKYAIRGQKKLGPTDAARRIGAVNQMFAVEWETGNVSSSHRALSKLLLGMRDGILCGGALVLPSRKLYNYLTDRIGNYPEVEPYFDIWRQCTATKHGILMVMVIEHDREDSSLPLLKKGTDGRALV